MKNDSRPRLLDPVAQQAPTARYAPPTEPLDPEVARLQAEVARLQRLLEEAGQAAEHGMVLLARADEQHARIEEHLQRSRDDLRLVTETIPQLVWRLRDDGDWTWGSPQWCAYTGQSGPVSHGLGWLGIVHPDDRDRTMEAWGGAEANNSLSVEHRLRRAADGCYRWFQTRSTPLRDAEGRTIEWFGTSTEVHELKQLQEHEARLLAELQHRVRNTLSVVRILARRTAEASADVESYAMHLDGRLNAFTRVQSALTRNPNASISLESLVADELRAILAREGERARITGPSVLLHYQAAEKFALAVHELATNALKYGALSEPRGRIAVTWQVGGTEPSTRLVFAWIETGVQGLSAVPERRGFGMDLLERTLAYELKARTTIRFTPQGLSCRIDVPLADIVIQKDAGLPSLG